MVVFDSSTMENKSPSQEPSSNDDDQRLTIITLSIASHSQSDDSQPKLFNFLQTEPQLQSQLQQETHPQPQPQPDPEPEPDPEPQPQPPSPPSLAPFYFTPLVSCPCPSPSPSPPSPPPLLVPNPGHSSQPSKRKQQISEPMKEGKPLTIEPPFPWATNRRAQIFSIDHLITNNMTSISGKVKCKGCQEEYDIEFNLREKFSKVAFFILNKKRSMKDRAPPIWNNPVLPNCNRCGKENVLKPVMAIKKRNTNWLFLLLGEMIGCCTLECLKYFCKHNQFHSTASKDRLIYSAYMGLCKMLKSEDLFNP